MDIDKLNAVATRVFFWAAFLLFALAVFEWTLSWMGRSLLQRMYLPGRLLEFAAICLIFVIALLLRQVRQELKKSGT
ncbi:MAG: hypothetical protein Q8Q85_09935 [Gemmatimonadales bacterium]|nr:hypothetical protein [Gemmatimonadales bacterium]